jgi:hypothetical protein
MIRIITKLFAVAVALSAFFPVAPLFAAPIVWISGTGSDANSCTAALPCATLFGAAAHMDQGGQINCLDSPGFAETNLSESFSFSLDCAGVYNTTNSGFAAIQLPTNNQVVKIRNFTITGTGGGFPAIKVTGSGSLILENCVFENFNASGAVPALDIEPNGPLNLVIKNSRISNNAGGVLIKPAAGGSVTATFDGVTIADNTGGGVKTDTTNGPVTVDISNSTITKNAGNGLNAVSGSSGQNNMLNLSHTVIAGNGSAGVQANGANSAALIDTTLLDSNAAGATSAVGGGRLLTYGNNRIVGAAGSGFTGTAPLN